MFLKSDAKIIKKKHITYVIIQKKIAYLTTSNLY